MQAFYAVVFKPDVDRPKDGMNQVDGTQQTWNAVGIIKDADNNLSDGMPVPL
jgi:hypothetical protein